MIWLADKAADGLGWFTFGSKHWSPLRLAAWLRGVGRLGPETEHWTATARDGVALSALRFPPRRHPHPPRLGVVICHGWVEARNLYVPLANLLVCHGHEVILFDHRGHGRSGGRHIGFGVLERHDVKSVIDAAQQRGWLGGASGRVITFGHSMGAATVIQHAAMDGRVAGVIASSPYATLRAAVASYHRTHAPFVSLDWALAGIERQAARLGMSVHDADTLSAAAALRVPVLLIMGRRDWLLRPPDHGYRVADAMDPRRRRIVMIDGANHFNLCHAAWPGLHEALLSFAAEMSACPATAATCCSTMARHEHPHPR